MDRIKGPVVINFFPTWCPDCRTEMPLMARRFKWLKTADRSRQRRPVLPTNFGLGTLGSVEGPPDQYRLLPEG
ncbi:redoxin domain-containing protein [Candidatus Nephthysia bennettiae]|uniref:redoxin domain-containing protein n=1 Tax=Candidatus Nephthysia bennettiae TaxID=3127016 RepID=UPI0030C65D75